MIKVRSLLRLTTRVIKGAYNRTSIPAARPAKFYLAQRTPAAGVKEGAGVDKGAGVEEGAGVD